MGVDYSAFTILGMMIKEETYSKLTSHKNRKPGCEHHPLQEGAKFCPECGAPSFISIERPRVYFSEFAYEMENKGFDVGYTTDDQHVVIGIGYKLDGQEDEPKRFPVITKQDEQDLINRLKIELVPLGLYNPDNYGYWSMIRCSY